MRYRIVEMYDGSFRIQKRVLFFWVYCVYMLTKEVISFRTLKDTESLLNIWKNNENSDKIKRIVK
jgi:hypothetical protein